MKKFEFHKSFKACEISKPQMAGTVGAGIQDGELFREMAKHNAIAVGGTNSVRNPTGRPMIRILKLTQNNRMLGSSDGLFQAVMDLPRASMAWDPIPLSRRSLSPLTERS